MKIPKEVSYTKPKVEVPIDLVGISTLSFPILYKFGSEEHLIYPSFELYVNLPKNLRGINVSRTYEVSDSVIRKYRKKYTSIEKIALLISKKLLEVHEYSTRSEVRFKTFINIPKHTEIRGLYNEVGYRVEGFAISRKEKKDIRAEIGLGVKTFGINACPCAQQEIRKIFMKEIKEGRIKQKIKNLLLTTHTQRVEAGLKMIRKVPRFPDFYFFGKILDRSFSSPIFHLLKREEEANLIIKAVKNPKFTEDIFRDIIYNFWKNYDKKLRNDDVIEVEVRSMESIHPHDMVVYGKFKGNELRQMFDNFYLRKKE